MKSAVLTTEGISMLFAAAILDSLTLAFDIIGIFTGIGLLLSKFVYAFGIMFVGLWEKVRGNPEEEVAESKEEGGEKGEGAAKQKTKGAVKKKASDFIKRNFGMIFKSFPILGSLYPAFTIRVYNKL